MGAGMELVVGELAGPSLEGLVVGDASALSDHTTFQVRSSE